MVVEEEEQRRADQHERRRCAYEEAVGPRREPAAREREHECGKRDEREAADEDARGPDDVAVRVAERCEEPEVADRREIDARAVVRPPPQRDEAAGDEAEPGGKRKRRRRDLVRLVIARRDDRDGPGRLDECDRDREEEQPPAHSRRARSAAPVSSSLATKPRAPRVVIRSP